ncbi:MAG: histidine phosphatase family protein [Leptolyngbyaceae cyanobacterium SL_7_1]|nr:histidine phosphatase family protein [Leptolyngbyaceae cyanobacterium SL_7_1]
MARAVKAVKAARAVKAVEGATTTPGRVFSPGVPAPVPAVPAEGGEGVEGYAEPAAFQDTLSGAALVSALREGGYVIFFRHAQTEVDYADQVFARMGHCATQRMLGEEGWQQARAIGQAFETLAIPVGEVYSSEYCRAWQTADLAFGRYEKLAALNFPPSSDYTEAQIAEMRNNLTPLLTAVPATGTNTVIVGHDDLFDAVTGIYPEPQGIAYIVKPDGQGGFEIVANVESEEWMQLAQ